MPRSLPRQFLCSITLLVGASCSTKADEAFVQDGLELWTRCRIAIENVQPLDVEGLSDLGFSVRTVPPLTFENVQFPVLPGYEQPQRKWRRPGSRFIVVESETLSRGKATRTCAVELSGDSAPITSDEEREIAAAFLAERERLITAGTHQVRNPDPIFSTNLGVGPVRQNSSGCTVISAIQIETRANLQPFFYATNGEQSGVDCGAATRLR